MTRLELDPAEIGPRASYSWLTQVVVPRPIAWVSSRSATGVDNLAPHSFFTVASQAPPVVQFTSVGRKDTLRNVEETGEFVVNVATEALALVVDETATDYPRAMGSSTPSGSSASRRPWSHRRGSATRRSPSSASWSGSTRSAPTRRRRPWCSGGSSGSPSPSRSSWTGGWTYAPRPVARLGGPFWATLGEVLRINRKKYEAPPA